MVGYLVAVLAVGAAGLLLFRSSLAVWHPLVARARTAMASDHPGLEVVIGGLLVDDTSIVLALLPAGACSGRLSERPASTWGTICVDRSRADISTLDRWRAAGHQLNLWADGVGSVHLAGTDSSKLRLDLSTP